MDTKKLRQKILDLAIRGKLVPQDPNDEPAVELLKRINPKFEACEKTFDTNELPVSWCWATLESVSTDSADGPFGSNLKKEHYTQNNEVRIIQLSNIGEEGWREENTKYTTFEHLKSISRSEVLPNDIVIAKMMPAGRAILCPNSEKKYVLSSDAVKFHLRDSIDCKYILSAINSEMFRKQVYENVQGVTRVRTSLQKLRKYCLPIPPFAEQKRIVTAIEQWFSLIDILENEKNELQASIQQAKSKILDLAIHGKLVPQDPNDEPAIELVKRINPKFEYCEKELDNNELPDNWCGVKLRNVCSDFIVPQRDKPTRFDGDIPWCRIEDIEGKYLNGSLSNQKVSMDLIKEMNMRICPVGTVLCSCSASLGIQAITTVPCCTNQTFIGIVPSKEVLYEDYLFYFLKSRTKLFFELGTGTTIKYISRTKFENLSIPLPPKQEQLRIVSKIEELFAVLDSIKESLDS